eukprot:TRINITY_DN2179_c0_g1_i2.p1 TRINITY_DN2179_c0_g1~~TRINITY_DN2179_c0_g1_i2.p1  ORF type:complete len:174 (-),score=17.26 TRINITY_DN2179_c0_g1_i2:213-734(-)
MTARTASPTLLAPHYFYLYNNATTFPVQTSFTLAPASHSQVKTYSEIPSETSFVQFFPVEAPSSKPSTSLVNTSKSDKYAGASFLTAPSPNLLPKPAFTFNISHSTPSTPVHESIKERRVMESRSAPSSRDASPKTSERKPRHNTTPPPSDRGAYNLELMSSQLKMLLNMPTE